MEREEYHQQMREDSEQECLQGYVASYHSFRERLAVCRGMLPHTIA